MDSAFITGVTIGGVPLAIAGAFFGTAISASPYHALFGKALGWPTSIIFGYVSGDALGAAILPEWTPWSAILYFGWGFFATWMMIGVAFHDDMVHRYGQTARWLWKRYKKQRQTHSTGSAQIRARAHRG